jgi:hypothetical protein
MASSVTKTEDFFLYRASGIIGTLDFDIQIWLKK